MPSTRLALTAEQRAELDHRDAIHQAVQQDRQAGPVRLRRSDEAHRMIAVQVVWTVH